MILDEVHEYLIKNRVSKVSAARAIGIHENSLREVLKRPNSNPARVIEWYINKRKGVVPQFKKEIIKDEIDSIVSSALRGDALFKQVKDLKEYINQL